MKYSMLICEQCHDGALKFHDDGNGCTSETLLECVRCGALHELESEEVAEEKAEK